ncbi:MAG: CPBP family intramembrane glutamic endopeptidase [Pseudomonadota bacterium]
MDPKTVKLKTVLFSLGAVAVLELAAGGLGTMWGLGLVRGLQAVAIVFIAVKTEGGPAPLGLERGTPVPGFVGGLYWSAAFGALALLGFILLSLLGFSPLEAFRVRLPGKLGDLLLFFLVGGIISPIAEEIFFRGLMVGFFRRGGLAAALAASTALFVLAHGPGRAALWTQAVGGLVFALAFERSRALTTPITIHVLGNLALFSLGLLWRAGFFRL